MPSGANFSPEGASLQRWRKPLPGAPPAPPQRTSPLLNRPSACSAAAYGTLDSRQHDTAMPGGTASPCPIRIKLGWDPHECGKPTEPNPRCPPVGPCFMTGVPATTITWSPLNWLVKPLAPSPLQGKVEFIKGRRFGPYLLQFAVSAPNPRYPARISKGALGSRTNMHARAAGRKPYIPSSRRKRANTRPIGEVAVVVLASRFWTGTANPDACDNYVVDGRLASVPKHDCPPHEPVIPRSISSISVLLVP